jgi:hypothetical protein
MTAAPIAFESAQGRYSFEGVAQLINAYAERGGKDKKGPLLVQPSDGLVEFVDTTGGLCRGLIYLPDLDAAYSIHPSSAYKITFDGTTATATRIGTIPGSDLVQLSRNQKASTPQVIVRSDAGLQVIESDTVAFVTDADLPSNSITADFVSGYSVYGFEDRSFYISAINDAQSIDPLDFATFQQRAGKLVRAIENAGNLLGFGNEWFEVWRDTGNVDFPFEPLTFRSRGALAPNAFARSNMTLMFAGNDGVVYQLNGYDPQRISTHSIEELIQEDENQADLQAFSWSRGGHAFMNMTGSTWSRCYDSTTAVWHTRQSYGYDTWRAQCSMQAWGKTIVGDKLTGKLFELDSETFTEDEGTMIWGVDSPPLHVFPNGAIVDALHIDIATGYGTASGQGSNPLLMLQTSTDGGNTFSNYRELELGITGNTGTRVTARRLGKFGPKGIVFRLRISDPVVRAIVGTDVQLRPLRQ